MGKQFSRQRRVDLSDDDWRPISNNIAITGALDDPSEESSQMDMGDSITVVVVKPGGESISLQMLHKMTVKHVKGEIHAQWQVHAASQKLIKNTEVAKDCETLSSLAVDGVVEFTLVVQAFISGPLAEGIETDCSYYIQPAKIYWDKCLSATASTRLDGSVGLVPYRPHMEAMDETQSANQTWRIFSGKDRSFNLSPSSLIDQAVLDLLNPSKQPCFREWGGYTGQRWIFEEVEGGYRMSTQFTPSLYLTVYENMGSNVLTMQPWEESLPTVVQVWMVRNSFVSSAS